MCGITGIISPHPIAEASLARMARRLRHRGPDDEGLWIDPSGRIGFGHRRLAIVDLSAAGHQPMKSADGRFILSFNGEIYNHSELRRKIDRDFGKMEWRGHSDTETLVEGIARWGVEATLKRSAGMFALSLWDAREKRLYLARDRFGEKPLYYGWVGGDFIFASEIPAIQLHPGFENRIDRSALGAFAARNYVPSPLSIYEDIYKLPPGCILSASPDAASEKPSGPLKPGCSNPHIGLSRYWSYRQLILDGLADPFEGEDASLAALENSLSQAVTSQSLADVPVGAFLSGGIDSSTIVALYQKYSRRPVRTYTVGFEDPAYDEAPAAREVARHLKTEHHELYVTARDAQDLIPKLGSIYGEPFADSSQIPTFLISQFARSEVKVALSGDGGDELFGGYNRYLRLASLWGRLEGLAPPIRAVAGGLIGAIPPWFWTRAATMAGRAPQPHRGGKIQKSLRAMGRAADTDAFQDMFLDEWWEEGAPVLDVGSSMPEFGEPGLGNDQPTAVTMMYRDAVGYLPDDILCKVDRASMAVSLESRVPYLDYRVAEVAARIPLGMKMRGGKGKYILRQLLYREAPQELFERPKTGFAIPVGDWIKGPLRDWAEELLEPSRMRAEGWFDVDLIHRRWKNHLSGRRDSTAALWSVLMFQSWLRSQAKPMALAA